MPGKNIPIFNSIWECEIKVGAGCVGCYCFLDDFKMGKDRKKKKHRALVPKIIQKILTMEPTGPKWTGVTKFMVPLQQYAEVCVTPIKIPNFPTILCKSRPIYIFPPNPTRL